MKTIYPYLLFILLLFGISKSGLYAQCPTNIGFEENSFNQWTGFTNGGNCNTYPCAINIPGIVPGRHTITSVVNGNDPIVTVIPQVCPFPGFGNYSVRLGNSGIGWQAERLVTSMFVTANNSSIIYAFAAILNEPANAPHAANESSRFSINISDVNGNSLPCGSYTYIIGQQIPFQRLSSSVVYRNWSTFAVDLTPYIGQTINVEFMTGDCGQGGHYGYAYYDVRCDIFQIATRYCPGDLTVQMVAPAGFQSYLWQPSGNTTQTLIVTNPLVDTVHSVTLTPFNGSQCNITIRDTIRRMDITSSFTPITCFGGSNGTGTGISINGTPFFSYQWSTSPVQTTQTATGLGVGSYVVAITDVTGCTLLDTVTIPSPPPGMTITRTTTNVTCFGASNGTAGVTVSGGNPGYTYSWNSSPVQTTAVATGLPRGTYTVVVTDQLGCELRDSSFVVGQPPQLTSNPTATAVSCFGASTGTATATASGGTPLYQYSWNTNPVQTTMTATGLSFGTYTVSITDANFCSITRTVSNTQPPAITVTNSTTPVICFGGNSGTATTTASGGVPGYSYSWFTNPLQTTPTATGLTAGTFVVTVTDVNNCSRNDTVNVGTLPALTGTTTTTPVFCLGGNNGTATITAGGGTPGYTYSWSTSPVQSGTTASGLPIGAYTVTITDANGCQLQRNASVTQLPTLTVTTSSTPVTCNGGNNGTVMASAGGGTPPYTYSWNSTPVQNADTATALFAGTYTVTVTDLNGCVVLGTAIVNEPPPLTGTTTTTPVYCFGGTNGVASANVFGGTPGYQYTWSTVPVQTTASATGLTNGTYGITITDSLGCTLTLVANVGTLPPIVPSTFFTEVSCAGGSDGTATVTAVGGSPAYTFTWLVSPPQTGQVATGLFAGTYDVEVRDIRNCVDTGSVIVLEPTPLQVSVSSTTVLCYGQATGTLSGSASGGVPGYQYVWNTVPSVTTTSVSGIAAGTYTLTARDSRGCLASGTTVVTQPALLQATTSFTQPLCFGGTDGTATGIPIGGTPPYTYLWNDAQTGQTAMGLSAGTYFVIVTDANACNTQTSVVVTQPTELMLTVSGVDLTCTVPPDNGIASVMATGATAPYRYLWNGGLSITQAYNTGFAAGTWTVVVTDTNNCSKSATVVLEDPELPIAHTLNDTFMCENSGGVPIGGWGTGGIPPYTFVWIPNNGSLSGVNFQNPLANPDTTTTYYLQVVDAAGCRSQLAPQQVIVYPLPIVDAGPDLNYCKDGPAIFLNAQVTNPSGMYDVQWHPSSGVYCDTCLTTYATPDTTTIFTVWVRSRLTGCRSINTTLNTLSSAVVHVKPRPIADAGPDTTICDGASATLCAVATGAGPNYTYKWSPSQTIANDALQCAVATPPHTMEYYLVASSDGCESIADTVRVNVTTLPVTDAGNVKNICEGDSIQLDGQVQIGMAQQFEWFPSNGLNSSTLMQPNASPSSTRWYYLRGYNAGCAGPWDSARVVVHSVPRAEAGLDTTICGGGEAYLRGNYTGGIQPVFIQWTPSTGLAVQNVLNPTAKPQTSTMYYFEAQSGTGNTICKTVDSVMITVLPGVIAMMSADTNKLCPGVAVNLEATGGVGSATYTWFPSTGLNGTRDKMVAMPDTTTLYSVEISEGLCKDTASVLLEVHPAPNAGFTMSQPEGCSKVEVVFNDLSANTLGYIWNFGDGSALNNERNPRHTFTKNGKYPVTLIVQGVGGCRDTMESTLEIQLREGLKVEAMSDPAAPVELYLPASDIRWEDKTVGATKWVWSFGDGNFGNARTVRHKFERPGTYFVELEVSDDKGCRELMKMGPYIVKEENLNIPNVFSPNGDGLNDFFRIAYEGDEAYHLQIYDRWGVKYFDTHNKEQGWDGKDLNGYEGAEGVYFYSLEIGPFSKNGTIMLIR